MMLQDIKSTFGVHKFYSTALTIFDTHMKLSDYSKKTASRLLQDSIDSMIFHQIKKDGYVYKKFKKVLRIDIPYVDEYSKYVEVRHKIVHTGYSPINFSLSDIESLILLVTNITDDIYNKIAIYDKQWYYADFG